MRINLYAGPGAGKSLVAAWLYDRLRIAGVRAELVREAIKPSAYAGKLPGEWEAIDFFTAQLQAERQWLNVGVPHVVTDSPLLLACYYQAMTDCPEADGCLTHARKFAERHPSVDVFLLRDDGFGYDAAGRYQDEAQSRLIDGEIMTFLVREGVSFVTVPVGDRETLFRVVYDAVRFAEANP